MNQGERWVQEHVAVVRDVVARIGGCLPEEVDFGDLAGQGLAALIEAAECYAGAPQRFAEFARARVTKRVSAWVRGSNWYRTEARPKAFAVREGEPEAAPAAVSAVLALEARGFLGMQGQPAEALGSAIADLPGLEQTVLALYFEEGLSLGEVAQVLACDLVSVRELFGRAGMMLAQEVASSSRPLPCR